MKKIILILVMTPLLCWSQIVNETMFFDALQSEYIVYLPTNYSDQSELPVVFNFHGGAGFAQDYIQINDMRPIADTAQFIAVYPQGALDYDGAEPGSEPSTSWLHKAPTTHNDVNFISAIIDSLSSKYSIDEQRIYACGYSEGAIFSYELACRLNQKIAAVAAVSGSMLTDFFREDYGFGLCTPTHPTAIMLIPGTADYSFHANYEGYEPYYLSAESIINYWSDYNNTDQDPIVDAIEDINPYDGSTVERRSWLNGENCVAIEELKVIDGGHDWPGAYGNMDISASSEIWNFVSKYDLNGLIDCSTSFIKNNKQTEPKLIKSINILGQENKNRKNALLIQIYDDGSVERKIIID